ncbi:MAG: hypothetical protein ACJA2S_004551, partial [Cyclobacteriaceae bacterium]
MRAIDIIKIRLLRFNILLKYACQVIHYSIPILYTP